MNRCVGIIFKRVAALTVAVCMLLAAGCQQEKTPSEG